MPGHAFLTSTLLPQVAPLRILPCNCDAFGRLTPDRRRIGRRKQLGMTCPGVGNASGISVYKSPDAPKCLQRATHQHVLSAYSSLAYCICSAICAVAMPPSTQDSNPSPEISIVLPLLPPAMFHNFQAHMLVSSRQHVCISVRCSFKFAIPLTAGLRHKKPNPSVPERTSRVLHRRANQGAVRFLSGRRR